MEFKTISVIGLGYIGLPTAAMFAANKIKVIGVDTSQHAVNTINQGKIHIVEPDLDKLVHAAVVDGFLKATTKPEKTQAYLLAVPTPFKGGHEPDLAYVEAAARSIAPVLSKGCLVILESTSPVGTTERVAEWLAEMRPDLSFPQHAGISADVNIAYCPERVLPGKIVQELVDNDRIIGGLTTRCSERAADLYRLFVRGQCLKTDSRTAEMCKLTENASRDVNIAFANELSLICDKLRINVWELIGLANHHPRVKILQPGPGVGGHCIAVDPWFIVHSAPDESRLIRTARIVNDSKPHYVVEKIKAAAMKFERPRIACLGLSFKADVDDLRESPAVDIVSCLGAEKIGEILVVEPHIDSLPASLSRYSNVNLASLTEAIEKADIISLLVNHKEFVAVHKDSLRNKVLIDTRGVWQ